LHYSLLYELLFGFTQEFGFKVYYLLAGWSKKKRPGIANFFVCCANQTECDRALETE